MGRYTATYKDDLETNIRSCCKNGTCYSVAFQKGLDNLWRCWYIVIDTKKQQSVYVLWEPTMSMTFASEELAIAYIKEQGYAVP